MKNAQLQTAKLSASGDANSNPKDYNKAGQLPVRKSTVTAHVLAQLLESEKLTGLESVFSKSTTRLGAVIHYLESPRYGWTIDRRTVSTGTKDGRIAEIAMYWLRDAAIAQSFKAGSRPWVDEVLQARANRRKQADKCKRIAKYKNIARKIDPRQATFWEGASC
jgi:hypothetical protein